MWILIINFIAYVFFKNYFEICGALWLIWMGPHADIRHINTG